MHSWQKAVAAPSSPAGRGHLAETVEASPVPRSSAVRTYHSEELSGQRLQDANNIASTSASAAGGTDEHYQDKIHRVARNAMMVGDWKDLLAGDGHYMKSTPWSGEWIQTRGNIRAWLEFQCMMDKDLSEAKNDPDLRRNTYFNEVAVTQEKSVTTSRALQPAAAKGRIRWADQAAAPDPSPRPPSTPRAAPRPQNDIASTPNSGLGSRGTAAANAATWEAREGGDPDGRAPAPELAFAALPLSSGTLGSEQDWQQSSARGVVRVPRPLLPPVSPLAGSDGADRLGGAPAAAAPGAAQIAQIIYDRTRTSLHYHKLARPPGQGTWWALEAERRPSETTSRLDLSPLEPFLAPPPSRDPSRATSLASSRAPSQVEHYQRAPSFPHQPAPYHLAPPPQQMQASRERGLAGVLPRPAPHAEAVERQASELALGTGAASVAGSQAVSQGAKTESTREGTTGSGKIAGWLFPGAKANQRESRKNDTGGAAPEVSQVGRQIPLQPQALPPSIAASSFVHAGVHLDAGHDDEYGMHV